MAIKGDFISFTYNGVHSTELGVLRVTSSNRYTDALLPTIQDKTVQVPGSDGTYFFGSYYTQRPITLNIAFDEVTEAQLRLIRKTLGGDRLSHELVFDDEPYKVYYAKVTGTPQLQYIPFSTPRIYKGEGTFTFTCFEPFAHCKNSQKYLSQFPGYTIDKELSGSLVSFNDGIGNLKKLEVKFNASQDLHGYSKPWAGGAGKNKAKLTAVSAGVSLYSDLTDNSVTVYNTSTSTGYKYKRFSVLSAQQYAGQTFRFSAKASVVTGATTPRIVARLYEADGTTTVGSNLFELTGTTFSRSITLPDTIADGVILCLNLYSDSGNGGANEISYSEIQLEVGSTATAFEPYENICPITGLTGLSVYVSPTQDQQDATTYTSDWASPAGTVYAGTVDLATGVLTVTKKGIDMGSVDWAKSSATSSVGGSVFSFPIGNIGDGMAPRVRYADNTMLSSMFSTAPASRWFVSQMLDNEMFSNELAIFVSASGYTDEQAFKEAVTGATLVYELATPAAYQLTAQEVSVLEGQNNIWSSSGNVTLIYNELTGKIEDWKIEWNPSANLLDEQGSYDTYDNITGFKIYNPGDLETDFKLIIPTSSNFTINGIIISNSLTLESKILTTSITSLKGEDALIQFNSKTNLIEGLDAQGARTGNLYNDCIVSGEWFRLPLTTDGNWHLQIVDYSNISEIAPKIIYDYLYF